MPQQMSKRRQHALRADAMSWDDFKAQRLERLTEALEMGYVDAEVIPYIHRLNRLSTLVTIDSCYGHIPYNGEMVQVEAEGQLHNYRLDHPLAKQAGRWHINTALDDVEVEIPVGSEHFGYICFVVPQATYTQIYGDIKTVMATGLFHPMLSYSEPFVEPKSEGLGTTNTEYMNAGVDPFYRCGLAWDVSHFQPAIAFACEWLEKHLAPTR